MTARSLTSGTSPSSPLCPRPPLFVPVRRNNFHPAARNFRADAHRRHRRNRADGLSVFVEVVTPDENFTAEGTPRIDAPRATPGELIMRENNIIGRKLSEDARSNFGERASNALGAARLFVAPFRRVNAPSGINH